MRLSILLLSCIVVLAEPQHIYAQLLGDAPTGGGLRLTVEPAGPPSPVPLRFTLVLTNISRDDIRLPQPHLEIGDDATGYLFLRAQFLQSGPTTTPGYGSGGVIDEWPHGPILSRVSRWKTLSPGESLRFDFDLRNAVPSAPAAGTYMIWADYHPPIVSHDDLRILQQNGIAVPTVVLATTKIEYHVPTN